MISLIQIKNMGSKNWALLIQGDYVKIMALKRGEGGFGITPISPRNATTRNLQNYCHNNHRFFSLEEESFLRALFMCLIHFFRMVFTTTFHFFNTNSQIFMSNLSDIIYSWTIFIKRTDHWLLLDYPLKFSEIGTHFLRIYRGRFCF